MCVLVSCAVWPVCALCCVGFVPAVWDVVCCCACVYLCFDTTRELCLGFVCCECCSLCFDKTRQPLIQKRGRRCDSVGCESARVRHTHLFREQLAVLFLLQRYGLVARRCWFDLFFSLWQRQHKTLGALALRPTWVSSCRRRLLVSSSSSRSCRIRDCI